MRVNLDDVQTLVLQSLGYSLSRHLLITFPDRSSAHKTLAHIYPMVCMGMINSKLDEGFVLNLSITCQGLRNFLPAEQIETFESAFKEGPWTADLGDIDSSASAHWWENQFETSQIHCIVHIHAATFTILEERSGSVIRILEDTGAHELIPRKDRSKLNGASLGPGKFGGGKVHFGYTDGLSQLSVSWDDEEMPAKSLNFRNFVLGYYSDELPSSPVKGEMAKHFRNSSYLVFRWIYQNVALFEQFINSVGPVCFPEFEPTFARELLAAKFMGRWRDGTPLVISPTSTAPELAATEFNYAGDLSGRCCPHSAHIRVVNPRDQSLNFVAARTGVPPLIRRGMSYGSELLTDVDDGVDRGIIGMFICSNIREQFIRLMSWMSRNNFSPAFRAHGRDQDPLFANKSINGSTREFLIPTEGKDLLVSNLPDFVKTKGTAFCLLPSRSALNYMLQQKK